MSPLNKGRRGVTSLLAMMYLILFATLALGFYAATTVSVQVVKNEQRMGKALLAAESGMDFMRYHLWQVQVPPLTADAALINEVYNDLSDALDGTGNFGQNFVGINAGLTHIEVPAGNENYVYLGNGLKFRAEITRRDRRLVVKVIGANSDVIASSDRAAVQLEYDAEEHPAPVFNHGLISRGAVSVLTKNLITATPSEHASVFSLSPVNPPVTIGTVGGTPGGIAGDITVVSGTTPTIHAGWSVEGSTNTADILANHVNYVAPADAPEMPAPDTSIYLPYATNPYVAGRLTYTNIIIPPNTNPLFNGPVNFYGVVYVKQPNKVTFAGQCNIQGVVVTENIGVGSLSTNVLTFSGNGGTKQGVESLPANDPQFAGLRDLAGSFIVAPGFDVQLTGNFGNLNGHITGDRVTLSGSSASVITGSLIALKNTLTLSGNTNVSFVRDENLGHAGLKFKERFGPVQSTYEEVRP